MRPSVHPHHSGPASDWDESYVVAKVVRRVAATGAEARRAQTDLGTASADGRASDRE